MEGERRRAATGLLDAVADFRAATDKADLWSRLDRHLAPFGIGGSIYGAQAIACHDTTLNHIANSIRTDWLDNKFAQDLFYCDDFVRHARVAHQPTLWADASRLPHLTPEALRSLEMDYDYGVVTGVTIPMRFADGLGVSALGCHAPDLSFAAFEAVWHRCRTRISRVARAFDLCLRCRLKEEMFTLSLREKECLLHVAAGHRAARIAARMGLTEKQVRAVAGHACRKLNATTLCQAVTVALVFDLILP
ncbi:helix-turn-helix transcriptional regulator [Niveispirillum fermenti]|uniref:helix-turn-helix transcriptional regulator n=1 Tax=Niveispirillum fermenti TaxID=1233113 RepID=UPI003A86B850